MVCLVVLFCILAGAIASSPEENLNLGRSGQAFFEGDIILTPQQRDAFAGLTRGSVPRYTWPKGVVAYEINTTLAVNPTAMSAITAAFAAWESTTCIKFVPRTTEKAYISLFKGSGCWSYVGRTGRKQQLSLAKGCWQKGTIAHELGHALGLYHEQSRPDRDTYVTIEWDNIKEANKHNFKKHDANQVDSLGTAYDYGSIMHYGEYYFSKNGKRTITPKTAGAAIGNRKDLSPIDIKQMNLLYKCNAGAGGGGNGGATNCKPDEWSRCGEYKKKGYCDKHKDLLKKYCQTTCQLCD